MNLLPIHGFVLAGGRSSRMGRDKALLQFRGRPMVEIAVEKLRSFCAEVSIAGNREDLSCFAEVVHERRVDEGPGSGIETGLQVCRQEWALFIPVDVPLVPGSLLRRYAEVVIEMGMAACHLGATSVGVEDGRPERLPGGLAVAGSGIGPAGIGRAGIGRAGIGTAGTQPAFCMLRSYLSQPFSAAMDGGERRLTRLLRQAAEAGNGVHCVHDLLDLYGTPDYKGPDAETVKRFFANVNTPEDLALAERWAAELEADALRG